MADHSTPHPKTADDELSFTLFVLIGAGAIAFVAAVFLFVM
jgi:hypothetical protein